MNAPLLSIGRVRHRRLRPVAHAFEYPSCLVMLPLRTMSATTSPALARNRFGWLAFHDRDHGDGRDDCLAWLDETLAAQGIVATGEVWLQCLPRVLGYAFKPVSFWYCERADRSLAAILVEVNNTFGERHCYLLENPGLAPGREMSVRKVLHVSPFCGEQGRYRFRFLRNDKRCVVRIELDDEHGPLLVTSLGGRLQPLTARNVRAALLAMPLASVAVFARIHWQALKLWIKRVPWFSKPPAPPCSLTRCARAPPPPRCVRRPLRGPRSWRCMRSGACVMAPC